MAAGLFPLAAEAAEAGYEAGITGARFSSNPFDRDTQTDAHDAWAAQWEQGHAVRSECEAGA